MRSRVAVPGLPVAHWPRAGNDASPARLGNDRMRGSGLVASLVSGGLLCVGAVVLIGTLTPGLRWFSVRPAPAEPAGPS